MKLAKHAPATCFCKRSNKNRENRHNIFADNTEIDAKHEEVTAKITTKVKYNNRGEEVKQEKEK